MTLRLPAALAFLTLLCAAAPGRAITVRVTSQALERTLRQQLFTQPGARYYLRGRGDQGCFIYAEDPQVSFREDRVVVHVKAHARVGTSVHGTCFGVTLRAEADVTLLPEAEGETVGFRQARVENLSESRELNLLLEPFLSRKLPQQMNLNAADLLRRALANSSQTTGYALTVQGLHIRSMQVSGDALLLDVDGELLVDQGQTAH